MLAEIFEHHTDPNQTLRLTGHQGACRRSSQVSGKVVLSPDVQYTHYALISATWSRMGESDGQSLRLVASSPTPPAWQNDAEQRLDVTSLHLLPHLVPTHSLSTSSCIPFPRDVVPTLRFRTLHFLHKVHFTPPQILSEWRRPVARRAQRAAWPVCHNADVVMVPSLEVRDRAKDVVFYIY